MTEHARTAPDRNEAAPYYFKYIERVGSGDIRDILAAQENDLVSFFSGISEEKSRFRYAPDKWSIRQLLSHVNDSERVFAFRAFWFARGFDSPLPSFDQDISARHATADERSWSSHIDEFRSVRKSTIDVFRFLPDEAWLRRGIASDNPFTVRALAYIAAGHALHHTAILQERYLTPAPR